ncbi:MAG: DUF885 domain-containing protein, partial [Lysobacterales bacterium CG_4_9_14_3_um_filter_62_6]
MRPTSALLTLALTAMLLTGCNRDQADAPAPAASTSTAALSTESLVKPWQTSVDGFIDGYFQHNPTQAANAGKHAFDGQLPDYSAAGLKATADWLHQQQDLIGGYADEQLDATQRFQRDYVLATIHGQLFWLEDSGFPARNPAFYGDNLSPSMYLTRPYAPLAQRMAAFVRYQEALPKAIEQIRGNFKPPLPASYIDLGVNTFAGYAKFFKDDVPGIFTEVKDEALQQRFANANAGAIAATQAMADWLSSLKPQATEDFALGAERFSRMLQATELVDLPLDQLKAVGEADLARNLASLKTACDLFAHGKTLAACVDQAQ